MEPVNVFEAQFYWISLELIGLLVREDFFISFTLFLEILCTVEAQQSTDNRLWAAREYRLFCKENSDQWLFEYTECRTVLHIKYNQNHIIQHA